MVSDHMACGVVGSDLMLRLGPEGAARALDEPDVRQMDYTGRPMKSMVFVGPQGLLDEDALAGWVDATVAFVATLPPKRRP